MTDTDTQHICPIAVNPVTRLYAVDDKQGREEWIAQMRQKGLTVWTDCELRFRFVQLVPAEVSEMIWRERKERQRQANETEAG